MSSMSSMSIFEYGNVRLSKVRARTTRTALFVCDNLGRARRAVCACDTAAWDFLPEARPVEGERM